MKKYQGNQLECATWDDNSYVVESIIDHRHKDNRKAKKYLEFPIHWKDFDSSEDSWLSYNECKDLQSLDDYGKVHPELKL